MDVKSFITLGPGLKCYPMVTTFSIGALFLWWIHTIETANIEKHTSLP